MFSPAQMAHPTMNVHSLNQPDLDAIARNLSYLDIAYVTPAESAVYEHELSAIASLNDALENATKALQGDNSQFWQHLYPMLSDAAALLTSQLAPLLDLNAERSLLITEHPVKRPLALIAHASQLTAFYFPP